MVTRTTSFPSISDDAVKRKTGKNWQQWFKLLDKVGAKTKSHKEIVKILSSRFGIQPWWQQMITVTYEQARGIRERYQTAGGYQVSVSTTFAVPVAVLYKSWYDGNSRRLWLQEKRLVLRSSRANKYLRFSWEDKIAHVEVHFYKKGTSKTQLTVQTSKLIDQHEVKTKRSYWKRALDKLKKLYNKDVGINEM